MKRRDVLRSMALAPLSVRLAQSADAPEANAVTHYLEAIAKLPEQTEADDKLATNAVTAPLNAAAKSLVDRSTPSLDLLRVGASTHHCDWGDRWTGKLFDGFPDLFMGGRKLARLAMLRARFAFRDKQDRTGIDWILDTLTFGRHFAQGKVMVSQFSGFAIEHGAIETVAAPLLRVGRDNLHYLSTRLTTLPSVVSIRDVVAGERAFFIGYMVPRGDPKPNDADIKKYLKFSDQLAQACDNPVAFASLRMDHKNDPDYINMLDNMDGLRLNAIPHVNAKRALLRAAIAIVEDGPKAIDRVPDPFDGKPFDLRTWATGFELTSRFALEKKPKASLVVGVR